MDKFSLKHKTIQSFFDFSGIGMHSGKDVTVSVRPAPVGSGLVFVRTDIAQDNEIRVCPDNIRDFYLGSCLQNEAGARIITMEHFMAVLSVLAITNLRVEISGEEMPILDGSAQGYYDLFAAVGLEIQAASYTPVRLPQQLWAVGKDASLCYLPGDTLKIYYYVDYKDSMVGQQQFAYEQQDVNFRQQLMKARTFGFFKDVQMMHDRGLALGGSFENALVIYDDHFSTPLRYSDEPVRHKVLDLLGDLYLLGCPVLGTIVAVKSSHALNGQLVKHIRVALNNNKEFMR